MLLKGGDGSEVELRLTRYQFPEIEDDHWDSNWLMVALRVQSPQGSWHTEDPALLTWEVRDLANWFEALANTQQEERELVFLEPCLGFRVTKQTADTVNLQVRLGHEFRPPWFDSWQKARVTLALSPDDLRLAAESLREELARFPIRSVHQ
jgi:hypothetical protein